MTTTAKKVFGTFRILRGTHQERDEEGNLKTYSARDAKNNVIRSGTDLRKFNTAKPSRFELLSLGDKEVDLGTEQRRELEAKTVAELKELAEDLEIDLSGATRKEDIIGVILGEV